LITYRQIPEVALLRFDLVQTDATFRSVSQHVGTVVDANDPAFRSDFECYFMGEETSSVRHIDRRFTCV